MQTRRSFLRTSLAATTAILADVSSIVANESPTLSKSPSEPSIDGVKFLTPEAPARLRLAFNMPWNEQKQRNWPVAVKAGGHSLEGFCLNEDGLVANVSPLRQMQLDVKTGILTAGPGCRLEEVNRFITAKKIMCASNS
jgi:FAD binding domain